MVFKIRMQYHSEHAVIVALCIDFLTSFLYSSHAVGIRPNFVLFVTGMLVLSSVARNGPTVQDKIL